MPKEIVMKKYHIAILTICILLITWGFSVAADLAKEGEADYTGAYSWTFKMLPMGEERLQMQYEITGVVVEAPEDSLLFRSAIYGLGSLHSAKGVYEDRGFIRYSRPDGDMVYATYESSGNWGSERKTTITFVGGTGKCTGITGGGVFSGKSGLKRPTEGVGVSITSGKIHWKTP